MGYAALSADGGLDCCVVEECRLDKAGGQQRTNGQEGLGCGLTKTTGQKRELVIGGREGEEGKLGCQGGETMDIINHQQPEQW